MGGTVQVTVRLSPGEEYRMTWETGWLSLIRHPDFLGQHGTFWHERLAFWRDNAWLKSDLAPAGYGLVVVDFVSRRVVSLQDYTRLAMHSCVLFADCDHRMREALLMITEGRVSAVRLQEPQGEHQGSPRAYRDVPLSTFGETPEEQLEAIQESFAYWFARSERTETIAPTSMSRISDWEPLALVLDHSPFQLVEGRGTAMEYRHAKAAIEDMGFVLSADEERRWSAWLDAERARDAVAAA